MRDAVRVVGYLDAGLGLGEVARGYAAALEAVGVPIARTVVPLPGRDQPRPWPAGAPEARIGANLVCINPQELPAALAGLPPDLLAGKANVGSWWWELPTFPAAWHDRFFLFDELWAGSAFIQAALARHAPMPVVRVPPVVDVAGAPAVAPDDARPFTFLTAFDFQSEPARKNPHGAIEAFKRAFAPGEPARLIVKSINADRRPDAAAALRALAGDAAIAFEDGPRPRADQLALLASCDAFVSLHRAEGFGLAIAEAMALGKPAIATGWSGNLDFMTAANSYPVRFELRPIAADQGPYPAGERWAEPDVVHAAALMRQVFERRDEARRVGARGAADLAAGYAPEVVGAIARDRLQLRLAAAEGRPPVGRRLHLLDLRADAGGRGLRGAADAAARLLGRRLWARQNEINLELAAALDALQAANRTQRARIDGLEAQVRALAERGR